MISGFLMGSILFDEVKTSGDIGLARFYVRRFLRLIPVYTAAMALGLFAMQASPAHLDWRIAETAWANLLYINNFLPITRQYMGWCWSLAIEEQFYLLLPGCILLFIWLGKGRLRILVGLMALSVALRYTVIHFSGIVPPLRFAAYTPAWSAWYDVVYDKPWMRFGGLLAGVTGAYLRCNYQPQLQRFFSHTGRVTVLSLGCIAVIVHVALTGRGAEFFDRIPFLARELWWAAFHDLFSLATMFLILAAMYTPRLLGGWLRSFLSWKGFYPVAQLSYSSYLVHPMLFMWLFPRLAVRLVPRLGAYGAIAMDSVVGLVVTFAVSAALYVTIERPCMRMRSHPAILKLIKILSRSSLNRSDAAGELRG